MQALENSPAHTPTIGSRLKTSNQPISCLSIIAQRKWLVVILFTLLYAVPTVKFAQHKALWDDEFFTLFISRGGPSEIFKALSTGGDQSAPGVFLVTYAALKVFGASHLSLRAPAIFGYWLACVCMLFFVSRRTSTVWGATAMLCPLATWAYFYAYDARGYAMLLGFSSLALLAWQSCGECRRGWAWSAVLALSTAAAVSSHYFGVFVITALAVGELTRSLYERRVRFSVWLALAFSVTPLLIWFPIIRSARHLVSHFWSNPGWSAVISGYATLLYPLPAALVLFAGVSAAVMLAGRQWLSHRPRRAFFACELAAALGLTAIPLLVMLVSKIALHGFTVRYGIPALLGILIVGIDIAYRVSKDSRAVRFTICVVVLFFVSLNMARYGRYLTTVVQLKPIYSALSAQEPLPIVTAETYWNYKLTFYAPREVAADLVYLTDPDLSVRYLRYDSADRSVMALRPWLPIRTHAYRAFIESQQRFLLLDGIGKWSWVSSDLVNRPEFRIQLVKRFGALLLFMVTREGSPRVSPTTLQPFPSGAAADLSTNMPRGTSMCSQIMPGDANCTVLR